MSKFEVITRIHAPAELCFDLSRDIGFHVKTMRDSVERAVAGRTDGLIELGESVTWEGRHFGVRQRLTSLITAMDRPHHFRDEMQRGAFAHLHHDHLFVSERGCTVMTDRLDFAAPLGPLGWLVDQMVISRYMRNLITQRARMIKEAAEERCGDKGGESGPTEHV